MKKRRKGGTYGVPYVPAKLSSLQNNLSSFLQRSEKNRLFPWDCYFYYLLIAENYMRHTKIVEYCGNYTHFYIDKL